MLGGRWVEAVPTHSQSDAGPVDVTLPKVALVPAMRFHLSSFLNQYFIWVSSKVNPGKKNPLLIFSVFQ